MAWITEHVTFSTPVTDHQTCTYGGASIGNAVGRRRLKGNATDAASSAPRTIVPIRLSAMVTAALRSAVGRLVQVTVTGNTTPGSSPNDRMVTDTFRRG